MIALAIIAGFITAYSIFVTYRIMREMRDRLG